MKKLFIILFATLSCSLYSQEKLIENTTINGYFGQIGNDLFFIQHTNEGRELWKTNGTTTGTVKVDTFFTGPLYLATLNDKILFRYENSDNGEELWMTDGTTYNKQLLKDIRPGADGSNPFTSEDGIYNGKLYFRATDDVNGRELWETDATPAGTKLVKDIAPGTSNSSPRDFKVANDLLFFVASGDNTGWELFVTNGTSAGTHLVKDIHPGAFDSNPIHLTKYGNKLIFSASDGTSHGRELWITDGTTENTNLVKDINPTTGSIYLGTCPFVVFNNKLYFFANDGTNGYELWSTNGTTGGTSMVKNVNPGSGSSENTYSHIVKLNNNKLIVTLDDGTNGLEPWVLDASTGNLEILKDITPGTATTLFLDKSIVINDTLFFTGDDNVHHKELWMSDGTTAGTKMLIDMKPGNYSSHPKYLNKIGDSFIFSTNNANDNRHLYAYNIKTPLKYLLTVKDGSGGNFYQAGDIVTITAEPPSNDKVFDKWTGDVSQLADTMQSTTMLVMPESNVNITSEWVRGMQLTVENGSGSGLYKSRQVVEISSDIPPEGKIFDKWSSGYEFNIADINAPATTVTIPITNITATATFKDAPLNTFTLIVDKGTGSGNYLSGDVVNISANEPPLNMVFDKWSGDTSAIADMYSTTTTLTMPAKNTGITPTYTDTTMNGDGDNNDIDNIIQADTDIPLFNMYPNPAKHHITIESRSGGDMLEIRNIHGNLINTFNTIDKEITIDVTNFEDGIYFVSFRKNNNYETKLLIKH